MSENKALVQRFPLRIDIPIAILAALVLLYLGIQKPLMTMEKLIFWESEYTILSSIKNLFSKSNYFIAIIILLFSIIFPFLKLFTLVGLWFIKMGDKTRKMSVKWLEFLGKWSMLDVFVVAIIIFISKSGWMTDADPKIGLYMFSAAIILSMIATYLVKFTLK